MAWYQMKPHQSDHMSWPSTVNAHGAYKEMKCTIFQLLCLPRARWLVEKRVIIRIYH
jgi:hypothetical protein